MILDAYRLTLQAFLQVPLCSFTSEPAATTPTVRPWSVWSLGGSILFDRHLAPVQIFNESEFVGNVILPYTRAGPSSCTISSREQTQRSSAAVHGLGYYLARSFYLIKGRKVGSLDCGVSFLFYLEAAEPDVETRQRTVSFQP